MKIVLIIAAILIVAAIVALAVREQMLKNKTNNENITGSEIKVYEGNLKSFNYNSSGDMNGGHYFLSANLSDDGKYVIIESENQISFDSKEEKRTVKVSSEIFNEIESLIIKNKMEEYEDLPNRDYEVLDASTYSVNYETKDGKSVSFSEIQDLPDAGRKALADIIKTLEAGLKK